MLRVLQIFKRLASLGLVLVAVSGVAAGAAIVTIPQVAEIVTAHEGTSADLEMRDLGLRSSMYSNDGTFLTHLVQEQNREPVTLDEIPQPVIDAIVGMEDSAFYEHNGVNFRAIFRAAVENLNAGGIEQGGSTITQQLIKQSILDSTQDLDRKSTEAFYALRLERQMTKDEILERYLNTVYFGSGAYGVQAAAEIYWGYEDVSSLGWEEAVMLAGLIRNPTRYDPTRNPELAIERRSVVINRMVGLELIDDDEATALRAVPLPAERQVPFDIKPTDYFTEEALQELLSLEALGEDYDARFRNVYFGGLTVETTYDLRAQAWAEEARDELLPDDDRGFTLAIAAVETHTGAVKAMVGGPEFTREQFNLTTDGLGRQAGSSMKTFVLAALFEAGYTPSDQVRGDSPCQFDNPGGVPNPYEVKGGSGGVQSLAAVTRSSNNCAFVRLGQVVGNEDVIEVANRLGIDTLVNPTDAVLSLPLGSKEVHPLSMASAYAAMGNDGLFNEPWYISRVLDRDGNVIYEHRSDPRRAISPQSSRMISQVLESNVRSGTGRAARLDNGHAAGGKTGTAQNYEDAWFVGYTEYLSTAVWIGHPDEKIPMRNVPGWGNMFGGKVPAATWGYFNNLYHADLEPLEFPDPESYGGGRYLKVEGEIDFCDAADRGNSTKETVMVDSDGDGVKDCFNPVTTLAILIDDAGNPILDSAGNTIPLDDGGNPITTNPVVDGGGGTTAPPTTAPTTQPPATTAAPPTQPPATPAPDQSTTQTTGGGG